MGVATEQQPCQKRASTRRTSSSGHFLSCFVTAAVALRRPWAFAHAFAVGGVAKREAAGAATTQPQPATAAAHLRPFRTRLLRGRSSGSAERAKGLNFSSEGLRPPEILASDECDDGYSSSCGGEAAGEAQDDEDLFFQGLGDAASAGDLSPFPPPRAAAPPGAEVERVTLAWKGAEVGRATRCRRYAAVRARRDLRQLEALRDKADRQASDQLAMTASDFAATLGCAALAAAFPSWADHWAAGESVRVALQSALFNATATKMTAGQEQWRRRGGKQGEPAAVASAEGGSSATVDTNDIPRAPAPAGTLVNFLLRNAIVPAAAHRGVTTAVGSLVSDSICSPDDAHGALGALGTALAKHFPPAC